MHIALTTGEPAGIGPEVAVKAAAGTAAPLTLIGDRDWLEKTAQKLGVALPQQVEIEHVPLAAPVTPGRLDARNSAYVLALLDRAIAGCRSGTFSALVTAPLHKGIINAAGHAFTGHTEYLAQKTGTAQVVMMLVGEARADALCFPLRVALATTHLPLAAVPGALTIDGLVAVLEVLGRDLVSRFGIAKPRIAVCGLNPHAGESGYLGREEIEIIGPAIEAAVVRGIAVEGPLPADTVFVPAHAQRFDAILAMYHDQGLAPLKFATFGHGVNVTLGLPFVRTSVDHGTALDLGGSGRADAASMAAAIRLAAELTRS
ncbi:MAG TPA: 4-hydroxythreonine-4-phosphate dehydrogenase PdxA [Burkholderiaceae bacterium]|nr:4-hydroxythreonine-4-phosphate dehydrogenase PdxA [Burkholderiaceae bacterium]